MSLSLKETLERSVELYARKMHADTMPEEREKFRAEYDAICAELRQELAKNGDLPIDLLPVQDSRAIDLYTFGLLSHRILSGTYSGSDVLLWLEAAEALEGA